MRHAPALTARSLLFLLWSAKDALPNRKHPLKDLVWPIQPGGVVTQIVINFLSARVLTAVGVPTLNGGIGWTLLVLVHSFSGRSTRIGNRCSCSGKFTARRFNARTVDHNKATGLPNQSLVRKDNRRVQKVNFTRASTGNSLEARKRRPRPRSSGTLHNTEHVSIPSKLRKHIWHSQHDVCELNCVIRIRSVFGDGNAPWTSMTNGLLSQSRLAAERSYASARSEK